jgi:hypothetical protein
MTAYHALAAIAAQPNVTIAFQECWVTGLRPNPTYKISSSHALELIETREKAIKPGNHHIRAKTTDWDLAITML